MKKRMLLGAAVLTLVFITACPNPTGLSFSIFTVTYRGNGHTAGSIPSGPERHRAGIDVTVKGNINNLYKYGYTFLGWTREGDNRPLLEEGDIFQISANTVLTAHWRQNSHNLSLRTDVYVTDDTHLFNNAVFNYGAQTAQTITVRNTGNMDSGTLTITLSNSVSFTVDPVSLGNLAPDETATFTITPNIGLDAGSYTSTVTVAGDTAVAWFNVSFTVDRALVEVAAITVAHPVAGASPNTTATINTGDNFSAGAVSWRLTSDDSGVTKFSNFGEYTAEVTLTITNSNFTFTGGLATATINGLPVSVSFGSDGTTAVLALDLAEAHTYLLRFYSRDGLSSPFTYTLIAENTEFHLPTRSHGAAPPTQYIVVRNAGNRASAPLNLAVTGINTNDTNFVPSATTIPNMPVDGEFLLSITPATGLGVGSYQAAVTISNSDIARNLGLRFSVYGLVYMIWVEGGELEPGVCLGGGDPNTNNPGFGEVVSVPG
ncbi:MAG: hypothetical protein FWC97_12445, partial [Treponema sp.]|nr:hypothetical protein [Treponema sp.]